METLPLARIADVLARSNHRCHYGERAELTLSDYGTRWRIDEAWSWDKDERNQRAACTGHLRRRGDLPRLEYERQLAAGRSEWACTR